MSKLKFKTMVVCVCMSKKLQFFRRKTTISGGSKEISHWQTSKLYGESNLLSFEPFLFCIVSFWGSDMYTYYDIKPAFLRYPATKIQTESTDRRCGDSGQDASEEKGDLHSLPHICTITMFVFPSYTHSALQVSSLIITNKFQHGNNVTSNLKCALMFPYILRRSYADLYQAKLLTTSLSEVNTTMENTTPHLRDIVRRQSPAHRLWFTSILYVLCTMGGQLL
jgi:hypothetical protein